DVNSITPVSMSMRTLFGNRGPCIGFRAFGVLAKIRGSRTLPGGAGTEARYEMSVTILGGAPMAKNILRTGKQNGPKTAVKGKRYRCATCRRRSPKAVKTPAPWYCPRCLEPKGTDVSR